ncbi:MAG: hypothetical protein D8H98_04500 [Prevotella sp.]|jgi:hypothetical protein|nr:MAG: hypothetical protein D8H98_04500 [Prevotella sp.]
MPNNELFIEHEEQMEKCFEQLAGHVINLNQERRIFVKLNACTNIAMVRKRAFLATKNESWCY